MLYEAIFLGVIAGWIFKGKITNLAKIRLDHVWLVFFAFGIQLGMDFLGSKGIAAVYDFRIYLYGLSYIMLFIFLWKQRQLPGIYLLGLGFFLNFLVIMVNGGAMPCTLIGLDPEYIAYLQSSSSVSYIPITEFTKLPWLADVMILPWPKAKAFSVGDVFISLGVFWLVYKTMKNPGSASRLTSVRGLKI